MKMKSTRKIAVTIGSVILMAVTASGCSFGYSIVGVRYENADKYTAGETDISADVKNLDLNWQVGTVNVSTHSGKDIEVREESKKPISEDLKLRWWLDGDTLRVQYAKSGIQLELKPGEEKDLSVTLPEDIELDELGVTGGNMEMDIPELQVENLNMDFTSGDVNARTDAKKIGFNGTSGRIRVETGEDTERIRGSLTSGNMDIEAGEADTVQVHGTSSDIFVKIDKAETLDTGSTSGKVTIESKDVRDLSVSTTSGGIQVTAEKVKNLNVGTNSGTEKLDILEAGDVELDSTSGDITAMLGAFEKLKVDTNSGKVTALLPDKPGFTARLDTNSGKIGGSLPLSGEEPLFRCGDGSKSVEIDTTSGNIRIESIK